MRLFAFLLIAFPLAELAVMIQVGSQIGVLATLMLLLLSAVVGVWVIRVGGLSTALRARARMSMGQAPDEAMVGGLFLALAGGLLLLPGFISDVAGFLLLLPPVQRALRQRLKVKAQAHAGRYEQEPFNTRTEREEPRARNVIEGEYQRHDDGADK